MNALGKFGAVCFDCDSTLSRLEGIDELASRYGRKDEVALLTEAAMNGELSIDDVYAKRLSIVRPDREAVAWLGERYVQELVPGARETIEALRRLGKPVYVVSGGLLPSVGYLAQALAIPMSHVYAVPIEFDASGAYRGFDQGSPLPRADGKAVVCRELADAPRRHCHGRRRNDGRRCPRRRRLRHRLRRRRLSRRRWRRVPTAMSRMPSSRRRSRSC